MKQVEYGVVEGNMIVRILLCDIQSVGFICKLLRLNAAVFVGEVGKAFAVIYLRFTLASDALAFMFAWARCNVCGGAGPQKCINYDHCIFHILYHNIDGLIIAFVVGVYLRLSFLIVVSVAYMTQDLDFLSFHV